MAPRWPRFDPPTGLYLAEEDYYEDDEEDDPDALKDPLYQIDLQVSPSSDRSSPGAVFPASGQARGLSPGLVHRRPQGGELLPCHVVTGFASLEPGASRVCPCGDPVSWGCVVTVLSAV